MINQIQLKELLHYSIITGKFYWLKSTAKRVKVGDVAGHLNSNGYGTIKINGKIYRTHRLAWFWVTGVWPESMIDHKNGKKDANYWLNLREATNSQNQCNRGIPSNNTSGYKGVCWNKSNKKWIAIIVENNMQKYLGSYETPELAYAERLKAEKKFHRDFANAGECKK